MPFEIRLWTPIPPTEPVDLASMQHNGFFRNVADMLVDMGMTPDPTPSNLPNATTDITVASDTCSVGSYLDEPAADTNTIPASPPIFVKNKNGLWTFMSAAQDAREAATGMSVSLAAMQRHIDTMIQQLEASGAVITPQLQAPVVINDNEVVSLQSKFNTLS